MNEFYKNKRVLVAGGGGFIGSHLVDSLLNNYAKVRVTQRNSTNKNLSAVLNKIEIVHADLMSLEDCLKATKDMEIVFDLAANVGGIQYNIDHPGTMFFKNSVSSLNLLEASRLNKIDRFLFTSSNAVYSPNVPVPHTEEDGFKHNPDESSAGYGWAKRAIELGAKFYSREFGMNIAIARLTNVYGPRDSGFYSKTEHVVPSLIKKIFDSQEIIKVWGSGNQTRSFIYVKDAAEAIMLLAEKYAVVDPMNIGSEENISIRELINHIIKISEKNLKVEFDISKPEGQLKKVVNLSKMNKELNWSPSYSIERGLRETIEWFKNSSL